MSTTIQAEPARKRRTIVYIDGYNWYHAIFKHHPEWKWLDIQRFCEGLRPDDDVLAVKLFSAIIDEENAQARQIGYFMALETLPKVRIILGAFQGRDVTCRGACGELYRVPEEKKTDVNIAVEIMSDAISGGCDHLLVISGDSDVQPAVEWVAKNRKQIKVTVFVPALAAQQRDRRTDYYRTKGLNVDCGFLPLAGLKFNQLKNAVLVSPGKFTVRPSSWKAINQI